MFDAFWARCEEAGVLVCAHISATGYHRYSGEWTGRYDFRPFTTTAFDYIANHGRSVSDFFTAMVAQGTTARHPGLRLLSIENGSDWVSHLMDLFKLYYHRYPGEFAGDPVDNFQRCVWITPYWEEPIDDLARHIPVERILAGSDFPHADGLLEPSAFIKGLGGFANHDIDRVMRDNLKSILG